MELSGKWMAVCPDDPIGHGPFDTPEEAKQADIDWRAMEGEEDTPEYIVVQLSAAAWAEYQENGGDIQDFTVTEESVMCLLSEFE